MMDLYHRIIEVVLPFSWVKYDFMKNAILAVIFIAPLFSLLGTIVVNNRMAFFSDVLGHSALTGIALGVLLGVSDPFWPMLIFIVALAVVINFFKGITGGSSDTTLGVFFAIAVSLGIVILSKGGGFNKFTTYLIGDILAISNSEIIMIVGLFILVFVYWIFLGNKLILISVNPVLAKSRGINVLLVETSFVVILAIVVAISIKLIGILVINSLLVLPPASARIFSKNVRIFTLSSILISLFSSIAGIITSYYLGTATGATIVLFCAIFYILASVSARFNK